MDIQCNLSLESEIIQSDGSMKNPNLMMNHDHIGAKGDESKMNMCVMNKPQSLNERGAAQENLHTTQGQMIL